MAQRSSMRWKLFGATLLAGVLPLLTAGWMLAAAAADLHADILAAAALEALLTAAVLAWLLSRVLARPLERIAAGARAIAQGEAQEIPPVGGSAEVEDLRGSLAAMVGALSAQTQQLETQYGEAERARTQNRAVLDAAGEAMILVSPDRHFLSVNRRFSEMFGIPADEVVGREFSALQLFVAGLFADPQTFVARVADTAADAEHEFADILEQRWPAQREIELSSRPVRTAQGVHLGRLYVCRDVTRERQLDRMKTEFLFLVSHELRTPLTSIKGFVDLLLEGEAGPLSGEQQEFLDIVKHSTDHLGALIDQLLDVSRIESGRIELELSAVDLTEILAEATDAVRPGVAAKDQALALDLPGELPAVWGNAERIKQIVANLLSNAHRYTPRGGSITVAARAEADQVRVSVRDTGIGLSTDEQAQLFSRFFRARNRATQEAGGTGLGLVITRALVELHGGEIAVVSAPDEGSTFSFTLPTAASAPAAASPAAAAPSGGRILVVGDEPGIASLVCRYLERAGYAVQTTQRVAEALRAARAERPDLIVLDIQLADASGHTLLERLKGDSTTATIPVVVLSVLEESGRAQQLGAAASLTKPVEGPRLLDCVHRILADQAGLAGVQDGAAER